MKMLHVDTLAIAKKMENAGLTRGQAGAIAESSSQVDASQIATKADLAEPRGDLIGQIYIAQAAGIGILIAVMKLLP